MPGHVGVVYQALGAVYTGRGTARTLWLLPDGTSVIARSASISCGAGAAVTAGDQGRLSTAPAAWLSRSLDNGAVNVGSYKIFVAVIGMMAVDLVG